MGQFRDSGVDGAATVTRPDGGRSAALPARSARLREREAVPGVRLLRARDRRGDFRRHMQRAILIGVVQHGRRRLVTPDGELLLYPGNGFLLPAAMAYWCMAPEPHSYRVVSVLPGLWRQLTGADAPRQPEILAAATPALLAVRRLVATLRSDPDPLAVDSCLLTVYESLPHTELQPTSGPVPDKVEVPVAALCAWLRAHCATPLRLTSLAAVGACDAGSLLREFQQALGLSPYAYLQQQRLHLAAQRLRESAEPLAAIAAATGFADAGHLQRCFRRAQGVSPDAYRQAAAT